MILDDSYPASIFVYTTHIVSSKGNGIGHYTYFTVTNIIIALSYIFEDISFFVHIISTVKHIPYTIDGMAEELTVSM